MTLVSEAFPYFILDARDSVCRRSAGLIAPGSRPTQPDPDLIIRLKWKSFLASWQIHSQRLSSINQTMAWCSIAAKFLVSDLIKLEVCIYKRSATLSFGSGHGQISIAINSTIVHEGIHTTSPPPYRRAVVYFYCEVVEPAIFLSWCYLRSRPFYRFSTTCYHLNVTIWDGEPLF